LFSTSSGSGRKIHAKWRIRRPHGDENMRESGESKSHVQLETSIPPGGASLESILCTEELHRRPPRPPDYAKENRALVALVSALADSPRTILQTLAETILDITQSDSAGLSLLTKDDGGKRFYWPAIAGMLNPHVGGGTPRDFGPCGDVLDRNCTLLFKHFERRYPYLLPVIPSAEECLLVPFYVGGKAVGTIWAIMHSDRRKFDAEDERVMGSLGKFACSAYQALESIDDLKFQIAEREKAETELRELTDGLEAQVRVRTEELSLIIETIPGLVWCAAPDGELNYLNRRMLHYTGSTLGAWAQLGWTNFLHPDDVEPTVRAWSRAVATGQPYEIQCRLRRSDSVYRWFRMLGQAARDNEGGVSRWYGLLIDIDDWKRAEAMLAGEKRLLEMVAGGHSMSGILEALCLLVESTAKGCYCSVVLVDSSGSRLEHGAAPSLPASFVTSIIGRPVNTDSGPCAMATYLNEQVISGDLKSETRWAAYEWCPMALAHGLQACWSTPISSMAGKVLGAFAIYYDEPRTPTPLDQSLIEQFTHIATIATERVQNDAMLRRSEAFLAEGQHLSRTGSFSWRVATDEITWSEELYRIFDFDQDVPVTLELIGTRVHPEDIPLLNDMIERARGVASDFEYEHRLQMPDHSVKYLHLIAHGTRDQDGRLEYIGAVQDLTERRLSEEALAKARSELAHVARVTSLGVLTASIAHEVSQPLSGIITNASTCLRMLSADPPNVDGACETARRMIRDGNRASEVITRLRALFSKKHAATESVDLNEATREVIALTLSELQRNRVILRSELADELPLVTGDRVQLQQVILNLVRNASDAMSAVGDRPRELLIRTDREADEYVRLTVQDVGVGFDAQGADRLFQAFYTTKNDGMGIGLSVGRSIIESHHGRLWAAANDGPGSTFSFSIPCGPEGAMGADRIRVMQTRAATDAA
jgi:PAS domain S-box-containing protein